MTNGAGKCDPGQCYSGYYFDAGKTSTCLRMLLFETFLLVILPSLTSGKFSIITK